MLKDSCLLLFALYLFNSTETQLKSQSISVRDTQIKTQEYKDNDGVSSSRSMKTWSSGHIFASRGGGGLLCSRRCRRGLLRQLGGLLEASPLLHLLMFGELDGVCDGLLRQRRRVILHGLVAWSSFGGSSVSSSVGSCGYAGGKGNDSPRVGTSILRPVGVPGMRGGECVPHPRLLFRLRQLLLHRRHIVWRRVACWDCRNVHHIVIEITPAGKCTSTTEAVCPSR
jgi:hypothetical protein